jgi:hypothetical protein
VPLLTAISPADGMEIFSATVTPQIMKIIQALEIVK